MSPAVKRTRIARWRSGGAVRRVRSRQCSPRIVHGIARHGSVHDRPAHGAIGSGRWRAEGGFSTRIASLVTSAKALSEAVEPVDDHVDQYKMMVVGHLTVRRMEYAPLVSW
jgi:hypothetical protein